MFIYIVIIFSTVPITLIFKFSLFFQVLFSFTPSEHFFRKIKIQEMKDGVE